MNKKAQTNQKLVRTTLRLKADLKKQSAKLAVEEGRTLQEIFNEALKEYLNNRGKKKAGKLVFYAKPLGLGDKPLTRDDIYGDPDPRYFK